MSALCAGVQKYSPLAARILFAQLFIVSGVGKVGSYAGTAAFMGAVGLPLPQMLLLITIAVEIGGGALLIVGWHARWAAAALCVFTFLASLIIHPFWNSDAGSFLSQLNHFMKNFAIMGGLLYVIAYGAGPLSVDTVRAARKSDRTA
jgi:putative oxidoreductase